MVKAKMNAHTLQDNYDMYDDQRSYSESTSTSDSFNEMKSKWYSAEELRKVRLLVFLALLQSALNLMCFQIKNIDIKCNIQKQKLLQPSFDYPIESIQEYQLSMPKLNSEKDIARTSEASRKVIV